ncbi:MAG: hypothetical protein ISS29_00235 [Candidatus Marinimicrobia bacterium]|nr:hypothetical protein [Candidatus Neomarinimicrobiota bacterium]
MSKWKKYIKWFEIVIDCIIIVCSFIFFHFLYEDPEVIGGMGAIIILCFFLKEWIYKYLVSTEIKINKNLPKVLVIILFISAFTFSSSISGEIRQTIYTLKQDVKYDIAGLKVVQSLISKRSSSNAAFKEVYVEPLIGDVRRLEYQVDVLEDEINEIQRKLKKLNLY